MRPVREASHSKRSRPKFEVPQEAALPPAAPWVYRAPEAAAAVTAPVTTQVPESAQPVSFFVEGLGVMAEGFTVFAKANAVALRAITVPFRLVTRLF